MTGALPPAPFGRLLTAMVTPMTADGAVDLDGAARLAEHLAATGHDGVVVAGSTGESATTSREEKADLLRAVVDAVGDRLRVVAGVGTSWTEQSCELARDAEKAGAHGLLVTTPAYNKPPQAGVVAHVEAVAAAADLPVMLYDVPARTGLALTTATIVRLAEHEQVVALKDAKGDLAATSAVLGQCDLAVYSGADELNLPLLAVGGCGAVSVIGHVAGERLAAMLRAYDGGDVAEARRLHLELTPLVTALFRVSNPVLVKAALGLVGVQVGPCRLPLVGPADDELAVLREDLAACGVLTTA